MGLEHEIMSAEIQRAEVGSRTIVVGFDGSELARKALELARTRAGNSGHIVVVYAARVAVDPVLSGPGVVPPAPTLAELGDHILRDVEGLVPDVNVTKQTRPDPAGSALLDAARDAGADEIVVGSRGHGRFRALLGSTSHSLVHHADRPIVVLTERAAEHSFAGTEPAQRIVVGYDGSEDAKAALAYARKHLKRNGELVVVHAYQAPPEWQGSWYHGAALGARLAQGERILEEIAADESIERELVADSPAVALAEVAARREADEIVVGSRGLGTLRAALGSVAHAILHEADRPVVIVPGPRDS
jgi:nucleotide-binding universal stress UspA family protein